MEIVDKNIIPFISGYATVIIGLWLTFHWFGFKVGIVTTLLWYGTSQLLSMD
jgi:hypothetical protein